ncbi:hypothetical protein AVEN_70609-1 [Araneus ventricosus]|uniref:Uncharacterized protein n=1 Tax=Araneus ventricosus TaxID=182803 RepID=A0A4Y2CFQ4_ARAVE|nr:hypothetical protein AVEN_70609-1 [Araneus ventricosus]
MSKIHRLADSSRFRVVDRWTSGYHRLMLHGVSTPLAMWSTEFGINSRKKIQLQRDPSQIVYVKQPHLMIMICYFRSEEEETPFPDSTFSTVRIFNKYNGSCFSKYPKRCKWLTSPSVVVIERPQNRYRHPIEKKNKEHRTILSRFKDHKRKGKAAERKGAVPRIPEPTSFLVEATFLTA